MITYKLTGVEEVLAELGEWTNFVSVQEVDKIVLRATEPLVEEIKSGYRASGLVKDGDLINSIDAFQRKRKGSSDPFFTYYVGPRWSFSIISRLQFLETIMITINNKEYEFKLTFSKIQQL